MCKLLEKTNALTLNVIPSSFFTQIYMLSMMSCGMEYHFDQCRLFFLAVFPPNSLCIPSLLTINKIQVAEKAFIKKVSVLPTLF